MSNDTDKGKLEIATAAHCRLKAHRKQNSKGGNNDRTIEVSLSASQDS